MPRTGDAPTSRRITSAFWPRWIDETSLGLRITCRVSIPSRNLTCPCDQRACVNAGEVVQASALHGLSEQEATSRLRTDGPNVLPDPQRRSVPRIAMEVLREPMFALL